MTLFNYSFPSVWASDMSLRSVTAQPIVSLRSDVQPRRSALLHYVNSLRGPHRRKLIVEYSSYFFGHKKYSRHLINLRLSHCSHLDYFNDVFTNFSGIADVSIT